AAAASPNVQKPGFLDIVARSPSALVVGNKTGDAADGEQGKAHHAPDEGENASHTFGGPGLVSPMSASPSPSSPGLSPSPASPPMLEKEELEDVSQNESGQESVDSGSSQAGEEGAGADFVASLPLQPAVHPVPGGRRRSSFLQQVLTEDFT
ncbi:unnamed protein product, partial [Amoebophrya sp. A120]